MVDALTIIHAVVSFLLIIVVLLQFGKGAELGATMGGSSQGIFTSSQKGNILTKITTLLAVLFLTNSICLSLLTNKQVDNSLMKGEAPVAAPLQSPAPPSTNATTPSEVPKDGIKSKKSENEQPSLMDKSGEAKPSESTTTK